MIKRTSFCVLVLEGLVGLHRTVHSLALLVGAVITVILNGLPWKQTEIILYPSTVFWFFYSFIEGYSISSKGVLPTVVDIMVI